MLASNLIHCNVLRLGAMMIQIGKKFYLRVVIKTISLQYPTRALAPIMLEDYRKVLVDRRGEVEQFTSDHIAECMKKGMYIFYFSYE